jgi:hypothetical protein
MNLRRGLMRIWIAFGALWACWNGALWYQQFAAEQRQIAALDECGKIYPPFPPPPPGYVPIGPPHLSPPPLASGGSLLNQFQADEAAVQWEDSEAKLHPQCAPTVGSVSLTDFIGMHASDRDALHQHSEGAIRASTITAVTRGLSVPASLLVVGLILGWVARGFRSA